MKPLYHRRRSAALFALALGGIARAALSQPLGVTSPGIASSASAESSAHAPAGEPPASATDSEKGEALRLKGNAAWSAGRYTEALADYEEARKLSQDPKISYNLAAVYQKLGRNADAFVSLSRFQSSASRQELEKIPNLDKRIADLRNKITALKVTTNVTGARVLVRDTVAGMTQVNKPLEIWSSEGKAVIEIIGEGYRSYRKEHVLQGGGALDLDVQLNHQSAPVTVVEKKTSSTPFWSQWWFWAGAGALVVGGAVTAYALSTEKSPATSTFGPGQYVTSSPSGPALRF